MQSSARTEQARFACFPVNFIFTTSFCAITHYNDKTLKLTIDGVLY